MGWFCKVHAQATNVYTFGENLTRSLSTICLRPGELEEWSKTLEEHEKLVYSQGGTLVPQFMISKTTRKATLHDKTI